MSPMPTKNDVVVVSPAPNSNSKNKNKNNSETYHAAGKEEVWKQQRRRRSRTLSPIRRRNINTTKNNDNNKATRSSVSPFRRRLDQWRYKMEDTVFDLCEVVDKAVENGKEEFVSEMRETYKIIKVEHDLFSTIVDEKKRQLQTSLQQKLKEQQQPTTSPSKVEQLRLYEQDLRSTRFVTKLNQMIATNISSCNDMVEYYTQRPELKEFTLTKELSRMNYTVITKDGTKTIRSTKDEATEDIVQYATELSEQQQQQQNDYGVNTGITSTTTTSSSNVVHEDDILWRSANQSLLGDVISSVTNEMGLVRPQLSVATFVDDLTMVLDFSTQRVMAEFFINVSVPHGLTGERLSLAGVVVSVVFCPKLNQMEAKIIHISPCPILSQEDAESMLEL